MPLYIQINVVKAAIFLVRRCQVRYFSGSAPLISLFFQFNAVNAAFFQFKAVNAAI